MSWKRMSGWIIIARWINLVVMIFSCSVFLSWVLCAPHSQRTRPLPHFAFLVYFPKEESNTPHKNPGWLKSPPELCIGWFNSRVCWGRRGIILNNKFYSTWSPFEGRPPPPSTHTLEDCTQGLRPKPWKAALLVTRTNQKRWPSSLSSVAPLLWKRYIIFKSASTVKLYEC